MKILYITSDFSFTVGGIYLHIEYLSRFIAVNNDVSIIYLNKNEDSVHTDKYNRKLFFIKNTGSKIKRFSLYPSKNITKIIEQVDPDIIHVHTLFDAIRFRIPKKYPSIFTNHSSSYLKLNKNPFLRKFVFPVFFKRFDSIICPSTELYDETVHDNKSMISNGVDTDRFNLLNRHNFDKIYFTEKFKIKSSYKLILLSTRRLEDKNGILEFLLSNISFFKKNINDLAYLIVGTGSQLETIKKLIKKHSLENIYLFGALPNEQIDQFYYFSDFSIIPSKMEAISISALESMAAGCIVAAAKVGGLKELINDGTDGFFLPDSLEFEEIINKIQPDRFHLIKDKAFSYVKEKYSWSKIASETADIYKSLS